MASHPAIPDGQMPYGNIITARIYPDEVKTAPGNESAQEFSDDAAATLVYQNYQAARTYLESHSWLLEWQYIDTLYQSPTYDRNIGPLGNTRAPRVSRFLVAKNANTMSRQVKRAIFAEQVPFFLRPTGNTTQAMCDAWTALLMKLLQRMDFKYHVELGIDCQTLQGTGIMKMGWEERRVITNTRQRKKGPKNQPVKISLPLSDKEIPTEESDEFEIVPVESVESWPFIEYRRLGTTLFDPKWCTPNRPDLCGYAIDVDFVTFADLQEMRELDCYANIPADDTLKTWLMTQGQSAATAGSQVEQGFTAQGAAHVSHAEARNRQTDYSPLEKPILLLEQWDRRSVKTMLEFDGRHLIIRNEEHDLGRIPHLSANWWSIDNAGYGMGIGRLNGPDQRVNQGVLNECLKMIAYPFNAPLITARGENAPTQNVIARMGGYMQVDPLGNNVLNSVGFLPMPAVPADAWRMLELSQKGSEDLSGANSQMMQGNLGGPGSSAARTATGASRIAGKADDTVAGPVDAVAEGIVIPVIQFLIDQVKRRMPLAEIRKILSEKNAKVIIDSIYEDQFLSAAMEVTVLAGQKLAAKSGIQQMIPLFLQIVQQPQLLQFLHARGDTVDFGVMLDLMMQVAELAQQPDIIRKLTPDEKQQIAQAQMGPAQAESQSKMQTEQLKGQNTIAAIHAKSEDDLANKAAEMAMAKTGEGIPMMRATGLVERGEDEKFLRGQMGDM